EVGDLDAVADEEEVARLDVQVLQPVLVHEVQRLGRVADVAQQVVAWDADQAGLEVLLVAVMEVAVGKLHDDDQLALDDLYLLGGQDEGVAQALDAVQRAFLLLGAGAVDVEGVEVAEDELDGLEEPAGRLTLPDLAEAAAAQGLDQAVAR